MATRAKRSATRCASASPRPTAGAEAVRRRLPPHRHNRRYRAAKAFAVGRPVADRHGELGAITGRTAAPGLVISDAGLTQRISRPFDAAPPSREGQSGRTGRQRLSHTPLFVLVRLSDHCRLAAVALLIFILIFLVFIIVVIGISRWDRDAGEAQPSKKAFGNSGTHVVWGAGGKRGVKFRRIDPASTRIVLIKAGPCGSMPLLPRPARSRNRACVQPPDAPLVLLPSGPGSPLDRSLIR
jgi:hypothetical protein